MGRGLVGLDIIGCGTGFLLVELAQRLGRDSRLIGFDPSEEALARIRLKLEIWGISNASLVPGAGGGNAARWAERRYHYV